MGGATLPGLGVTISNISVLLRCVRLHQKVPIYLSWAWPKAVSEFVCLCVSVSLCMFVSR